jgi:predicted transglutaminase-like cysteine proteinase
MKLFSDKFLEAYGSMIKENIAEILGLKKATIVFYPFITNKGFKDVRTVFSDKPEDLAKLKEYYKKFYDAGKTWEEKIANVARMVNIRINYINDEYNWGASEYWASPYNTHFYKKDDCDGFACLMCQALRLCGLSEYEVFVAVGDTYHVTSKNVRTSDGEYHAYCVVLNPKNFLYYPVEGSWYPDLSMKEWDMGQPLPWISHPRYGDISWMTNDKLSFSSTPFFRFIK